jgi:hypothetical protein
MFLFLILFFGAAHHLLQIEHRHKILALNLFLIGTISILRLWDKKTIEYNHVIKACKEIASASHTSANEQ